MCGRCHAIAGSDAMGRSGPNLTHFASRGSFAGASYPNTADNVTMWLNDPQHMKPGNLMPKPNLSPDEIRSLVVYLASLK
jgi:cytochrome c oxidase subunit 2